MRLKAPDLGAFAAYPVHAPVSHSVRSPGSSATDLVKERRSVEWCPVLHGEHGQLDSGVDAELGEHVLQMRIDRVR